MRAPLRRTIGLGLPLLFGLYAACSGDSFEVGGTGGGNGATTSSAGTGGGLAASSSVSAGGGGTSSASTASGMGGAGTSDAASATSAEATGVGGAATSSVAGPGSSTAGVGGGPPSSWCEANGQLHYFCADFDGADLLFGWDDFVFELGLSGTPELAQFSSPPVSLKVAGGVDNADSWGVLAKDYAAGPLHTVVEVDLRHGGAIFNAADQGSISLITLSHDGGTIAFGLGAGGFWVKHQGGVDTTLPLQPLDPNKWVRVGLAVTYSVLAQGGEITVSYDGMSVGKLANIQTLEDPQAQGVTAYLGQLRAGSTPAFTAFFDNVTWSVD